MATTSSSKCSMCGKTFYSSSYSSTCSDCKRDKENHKKLEKLQQNQQRHEAELKERELEQRQRIFEQNKRHNEEIFRKQQELEEYRMQEKRELQDEIMSKQELDSIKNKVYNLAANSTDNENTARLIKLLLQQHEEHNEYIYYSVVALGDPFTNIIKEIISSKITDTINRRYSKTDYSFQRKSVKYFMPDFDGYEFEVFFERLINKLEFENAIREEIERTELVRVQYSEKKMQEIEDNKRTISDFENAIENDTYANNSLAKSIKTYKGLFGEEMSVIPRLNIVLIALYAGFVYFFEMQLEGILLLILMITGYIVTYAIISNNNKRENTYREADEIISDNKETLRDLIDKNTDLETEIIHNDYDKKELKDALIAYLKNNEPQHD